MAAIWNLNDLFHRSQFFNTMPIFNRTLCFILFLKFFSSYFLKIFHVAGKINYCNLQVFIYKVVPSVSSCIYLNTARDPIPRQRIQPQTKLKANDFINCIGKLLQTGFVTYWLNAVFGWATYFTPILVFFFRHNIRSLVAF